MRLWQRLDCKFNCYFTYSGNLSLYIIQLGLCLLIKTRIIIWWFNLLNFSHWSIIKILFLSSSSNWAWCETSINYSIFDWDKHIFCASWTSSIDHSYKNQELNCKLVLILNMRACCVLEKKMRIFFLFLLSFYIQDTLWQCQAVSFRSFSCWNYFS